MRTIEISPEIICSCGRCIFEVDSIFCASCGDVACKDCYTDCLTCGKMYCHNCSQSPAQCLKCDLNRSLKKDEEKAFLVLNGKNPIPIKNSKFMIGATARHDARNITLTIDGKTYKFKYRSLNQTEEDRNRFDYFIHFEEVNELEEKIRSIFEGYEDYEDYSTLEW